MLIENPGGASAVASDNPHFEVRSRGHVSYTKSFPRLLRALGSRVARILAAFIAGECFLMDAIDIRRRPGRADLDGRLGRLRRRVGQDHMLILRAPLFVPRRAGASHNRPPPRGR